MRVHGPAFGISLWDNKKNQSDKPVLPVIQGGKKPDKSENQLDSKGNPLRRGLVRTETPASAKA